jgi:hypothetical protein
MLRREQGWAFRGPQDDLWRCELGLDGDIL